MSGHDTERAFIQSMLEIQQQKLDRAAAEMTAELDRYHDDAVTRVADMIQAHQDRVRQLQEDQRAWLKSLYDDDEPAHTQDVAQQISHDASSPGKPATPGPGSAGRPDRHAAELAEADRIRSMSMTEYAQRRAELGVRGPTDMSRLFGETR